MKRNPWKLQQLGDVLTFQRGFDITKDQQCPGPYAVISSSGPKSTHSEFKVRGPGVVIGRKGLLGCVFYSEESFWPHDTTLWVKDFHGNHPRFAYYFLQTMGFERLDVGAANPSLNRNHIHTLRVLWPTLAAQRRIAGILSAYDELIENSQRRISILEEMARKLYREWFVQFRYAGHEGQRMVPSALGEIPEGWEVTTLGAIAEEVRRSVPKGPIEEPQPYVGLEHIPRRAYMLDEWEMATSLGSNKLAFKRGEVLFSKIRPYFHKVSLAPFDGICSADTIVLRARNLDLTAFVTATLASDEVVAYASATANGAKMPRASWSVLARYEVAVPPGPYATLFSAMFDSIIEQQRTLMLRNHNLRRTRDLLLPRLLSGQIDVEVL